MLCTRFAAFAFIHYNDVIMDSMASQITSLTIVYSTLYSCADHRKHQSTTSLAFVRGIHRWPVNSQHKGPVTRKMFPFNDVIMSTEYAYVLRDGIGRTVVLYLLWFYHVDGGTSRALHLNRLAVLIQALAFMDALGSILGLHICGSRHRQRLCNSP